MSTTWFESPSHADPMQTYRGEHQPAVDPAMEPTAVIPYVLQHELGHGGMGAVHLARQNRLGRDVAIKQALVPAGEPLLLAEACLTGRLEHPNIVPVYDLAHGLEGPQLVMKRIQGTVWTDLLSGVSPLPEGSTDPVGWHLQVLLEVCQAVAFAHDRGILHRDIKPDNVMVGSFGEVYVMDWGLAVRTTRTASGRLVDLVGQRHLQGTPCYMPPEMFSVDGPVGETSDTYLLGAVLWHCLTGGPPRPVLSIEALRDLAQQEPTPPTDWPWALQRLVRAAMDPDPTRRPTVVAFRDALRHHLATRSSERLLAGVETLVAQVEQADDVPYEAFGAAQFVLRDLQRDKPHPVAQALGRRLVVAMVRRELAAENAGAAQALVAQADVPDDLRREVEEATAQQRSLRHRLVYLETRLDRTTYAGARVAMGLALGIAWVAIPIALSLAGMERGVDWMLIHGTASGATLVIGTALLWRRLWGSYVNWSIVVLVGLHPVYTYALAAVAVLSNLTPEQLTPIRAVFDGLLMLASSLLFDLRVTPAAMMYLLAAVAVAAFPAYASVILIPATVLLVATLVTVWGLPAVWAWLKARRSKRDPSLTTPGTSSTQRD